MSDHLTDRPRSDDPILVVGAGPIGSEYVKVLRRLGCRKVDVLTRSEASADQAVARLHANKGFAGGDATLARIAGDYPGVVIAVPVEALLASLRVVAAAAPRARVLIEKPVALRSTDLQRFLADFPDCSAIAALNRLYFPSVVALRRRLAEDKPLSARFCFTEWVHRIPTDRFPAPVLARWGVANSIHLISTVFDLLGPPQEINAIVAGQNAISWHPAGARFYGCGRTTAGLPFAYDADWESNGRYAIEIFTAAGAYLARPLHQLSFTPRGEVQEEILEPLYQGDIKCGFEGLTVAFLADLPADRQRLGLPRLLEHIRTVETIFGYDGSRPSTSSGT